MLKINNGLNLTLLTKIIYETKIELNSILSTQYDLKRSQFKIIFEFNSNQKT